MRTGTLVGYLRTSNLRRGIVVINLTAALRTLRPHHKLTAVIRMNRRRRLSRVTQGLGYTRLRLSKVIQGLGYTRLRLSKVIQGLGYTRLRLSKVTSFGGGR